MMSHPSPERILPAGLGDPQHVLALEEFLPYRLNRLAEKVSREFSKIYVSRYQLTRPEWRTLATLGQYGTMTAKEIGAHSSMHKTKVSRAVSALEKRKWLQRSADAIDRRVEHLTLTKAGQAIYRELVPLMQEHEARILGRSTSAERQSILRAIDELERALKI
jgi:DNA-binding MarR family transcriptional regulator